MKQPQAEGKAALVFRNGTEMLARVRRLLLGLLLGCVSLHARESHGAIQGDTVTPATVA